MKNEELKTLKDFETDYPDSGETILIERLKAEAVKWAKKFKKAEKTHAKHIIGKTLRTQAFMTFFNITEEDLK